MIGRLRAALRRARGRDYPGQIRAEAWRAFRTLESAKGPTDRRLLRQARDYAADVLGWRGYAPWLYVYTAVAGEFREGWIPFDYYLLFVSSKMKGVYGRMSYLRASHKLFFDSAAFPDVAYAVNGIFYSRDLKPISREALDELLAQSPGGLVFKSDSSARGRGIHFLEPGRAGIGTIARSGNGVFQSRVVQHQSFDAFTPSAVATLRITTAIDDGGRPSPRGCYLRLGRTGDTHVKSATSIRVAVDPKKGRLASEGFLADWRPIDRHPDTGRRFDDHRVPSFSECISTALELHARYPFSRCIGWDLALDKNEEVKVLEWNGAHNAISLTEATQGPCFADLRWHQLHRA
jgi:Sugar-transfer associated ATP-grasp